MVPVGRMDLGELYEQINGPQRSIDPIIKPYQPYYDSGVPNPLNLYVRQRISLKLPPQRQSNRQVARE